MTFRAITILLLTAATAALAFGAPPENSVSRLPLATGGVRAPETMSAPIAPGPPSSSQPLEATPIALDLPTALQWTLSSNPDLVTQRQNLPVSAAAVAVARRLPTSLNPTVAVDVRPWVFEQIPGDGVQRLDSQVTVSWAQPIEVGHRTLLRTAIAQAQFSQTQWNILQAELTAMVQTYKAHQQALYRREKLAVAGQLAELNERLLATLRRQVEANRATPADLVLTEVESQATRQQFETARQEYAVALSEFRNQMGMRRFAAAEPCGTLMPPQTKVPLAEEPQAEEPLVRSAIACRPEIQAARATAAGSRAAVSLARADRIPVPSIGPVYERNETGASFYGLAVATPVPVFNAGGPALHQREAEHRRDCVAATQLEEKVATQVRASVGRWRQSDYSLRRTQALIEPIRQQADRMEHLYQAGQTDVIKLLQVRTRLVETENGRLDALWQVIQSYADLLTATGTAPLVGE